MNSFFTKAKASVKPVSKASSSAAGPSTIVSDFDKTFKPFVLKKGAQLAPINAFLERRPTTSVFSNGAPNDVIVIYDDDEPPSSTADIAHMGAQGQIGFRPTYLGIHSL